MELLNYLVRDNLRKLSMNMFRYISTVYLERIQLCDIQKVCTCKPFPFVIPKNTCGNTHTPIIAQFTSELGSDVIHCTYKSSYDETESGIAFSISENRMCSMYVKNGIGQTEYSVIISGKSLLLNGTLFEIDELESSLFQASTVTDFDFQFILDAMKKG